jgi:hypothetical protein
MLVSINYRKEFQMKPVVQSLLETDLYKFTMWQALLHSHPNTQTEYAFVCRNTPAYPLAELKDDVERELDHLCSLKFTEDELDYLRSLRFIKSDFTDFLALFHFQRKFIKVSTNGEQLEIVAAGPQVHVSAFEIFVLHIVNELYFRRLQTDATLPEARRRLAAKLSQLQAFAQEPKNFIRLSFLILACVAVFPEPGMTKSSPRWRAKYRNFSKVHRTSISLRNITSYRWERWRMNTCSPISLLVYVCAIFRKRRWKTGCRNIAVISALL